MEEDNLPIILDGKFFKIVSEKGDVIVAKCMNCVNKTLSESRRATTNFLRHIKVRTSSLIHASMLSTTRTRARGRV
jgi:hypothetical protein